MSRYIHALCIYGLLMVYYLQVENIIGGMRGLKAMLWEASVLDPLEVNLIETGDLPPH